MEGMWGEMEGSGDIWGGERVNQKDSQGGHKKDRFTCEVGRRESPR